MSENEINTVHVLIRRFLYEIDGILGDKYKCQEWLVSFAKTLQFQDLCKEPNEYAVFLLREARVFCATQKRNSQIKQVRKILKEEGILSPTKKQLETRWKEMYGLEEANETTAGAPNGNNGDCDHSRESALPDSTTACGNNKGRSPAVEGSARFPGSAGERPKNLGSARPSTDGDTRKDSRNITSSSNGASLESATSVDKSYAQALDSLNDKASDQAASNTGNVKPVTCRESGNLSEVTAKKPLAGGMLPSSSLKPPASSGAVDVLSLAYSGEFQNVKLTQEQYAELGIRFGNLAKLNRAIDSLSCKLENEEIKPAPKNHYAVLLKWASYRDDMEEQKQLQSETPKMTEMEKSWIRESEKIARYEKELSANERR